MNSVNRSQLLKNWIPRFPLGVFLFTRLFTLLWLLAVGSILLKPEFPLGPGYAPPLAGIPTAGFINEHLLMPWYRWDTQHYLQIAMQGYASAVHNAAWPPLYSLLIFLLSQVVQNPLLAGLLISNAAGLAALVVVYRLVCQEFDVQTARRTLIGLAVFPAAFFLSAAYTEAIFLALAAGSLWAARRQRFWLAVALAAAGALVRMVGVLLIVPLAWEIWQRHRGNLPALLRAGLALWAVPLAYVLFVLWIRFGVLGVWPWETISSSWDLVYAFPWTGILANLQALVQAGQGYPVPVGTTLLDVVAALGAGALLIVGARRQPVSFTLYAAVMLAAGLVKVTSGGLLMSTTRYLLPLFPIFITLTQILRPRWLRLALFILAILLQLMLAAVFWAGFWVA